MLTSFEDGNVTERRKSFIRNEEFEKYVKKAFNQLSEYEKSTIPKYIYAQKAFNTFINNKPLDNKLSLLTYANKRWFICVYDDKDGLKFSDFQKAFNLYLDKESNIDAVKKIDEMNMFVLSHHATAKFMSLSSHIFNKSVYKLAAHYKTLEKLYSDDRVGRLPTIGERVKANETVFKMFFSVLLSAFNLHNELDNYNITIKEFIVLGNLVFAEYPMTSDRLMNTKESVIEIRRHKSPRLFHLVNLGYIEEHKMDNGKKCYVASPRGIFTFIRILKSLIDRRNESDQ
jgi:hypothetical protein